MIQSNNVKEYMTGEMPNLCSEDEEILCIKELYKARICS